MATMFHDEPGSRHLERLENVRPAMAKADLNSVDLEWREQVGRAIELAVKLAGLTPGEAAVLVDKDRGQFSRWLDGKERPHFDVLFAVEALQRPLLEALARMRGMRVVVETTMRIREVA